MPANHKLYYFNARGRAEIIRLTFAATGIEYEDIRFTREEWVSKYKAMSPSGQAPFVECPTGVKTQSNAIARTLARKFNMMGETDQEYYQVERMLGQVDDIFMEVMKCFFAPDAQKEEMKKNFLETKGPQLMDVLFQYKNESGTAFAAGNKLTLADLALLVLSDVLKGAFPDFFKKYDKLEVHYQAILKSNEKIANHIKNRPVTEM